MTKRESTIYVAYIHLWVHICLYMCIKNCPCGSVAKASDTQAVGRGSSPFRNIKICLKYYLEVILYKCV